MTGQPFNPLLRLFRHQRKISGQTKYEWNAGKMRNAMEDLDVCKGRELDGEVMQVDEDKSSVDRETRF